MLLISRVVVLGTCTGTWMTEYWLQLCSLAVCDQQLTQTGKSALMAVVVADRLNRKYAMRCRQRRTEARVYGVSENDTGLAHCNSLKCAIFAFLSFLPNNTEH